MCFKNKFKVRKDNISNHYFRNTDSNNKKHIHKFSLVFSKVRIALLNEIFTYRSELSSLQLLTRQLTKNIKAHFEDLIKDNILGDGTCVISFTSHGATFFKLHMYISITEILINISNVRWHCKIKSF